MYERFFQLRHRPFAAAPSAQRYIALNSIDQARQTLLRCIDRAEGPGLVVGPSGIGKTLLCQSLAQHFRSRFQVALLSGGRLGTRRALLQNILFELKLPYRELDENELRLSLVDHLEQREGTSEGLLLLVDEAHLLPLRLLEEVRLLTNLVHDGQPRVRLVLCGGSAMEERLTSPKLDSLQQRLAARCYLQPLNRDETIYYVQQQIEQAGGDCYRLFTHEALQAVHSASDGIPRLINQVCDHALVLAGLAQLSQLDVPAIEEAWADLQQLPAPWHETTQAVAVETGSADIIEFGPLDEPGAPRPTAQVAVAAEQRLDLVDRGVAALSDDFAQEGHVSATLPAIHQGDFQPGEESATEVELIFPATHDPFGGHWEEEEVVIDRYASLEAKVVGNRPRVTSDEGRKLGTALASIDAHGERPRTSHRRSPEAFSTKKSEALKSRGAQAHERSLSEGIGDYGAVMNAFDLDPASDPVLPDPQLPSMQGVRSTPISIEDLVSEDLNDDDRDIIVIEDSSATPLRNVFATETKRQDYRRLFSTLRNR